MTPLIRSAGLTNFADLAEQCRLDVQAERQLMGALGRQFEQAGDLARGDLEDGFSEAMRRHLDKECTTVQNVLARYFREVGCSEWVRVILLRRVPRCKLDVPFSEVELGLSPNNSLHLQRQPSMLVSDTRSRQRAASDT